MMRGMSGRVGSMGFAGALAAGATLAVGLGVLAAQGDAGREHAPAPRWRQHDIQRPKPKVIEPRAAIAAEPPQGAVVLFDGKGLDAWQSPGGRPARWRVRDGFFETVPGAGQLETKGKFGDIQLHIEWAAPSPPRGRSQDRGNSGVFLMGEFEVQVLDSFQAETYADGQAGAIYGQYPPLFNATRPPGEWQAYDVAFRRPRFGSDGALREPARITVFCNGILVQNNEEPFGPTSWLKWLPYADKGGRGPITLQDHDHPVRYRNIWLLELPDRPAPPAERQAHPKAVELANDVLDRYVGQYLLNDTPNSPKATVARQDGHLTLSFPFRPQPLELVPISETEFDMPFTDGDLKFQKDSQGRVESLLFRVGDGKRAMKRVSP